MYDFIGVKELFGDVFEWNFDYWELKLLVVFEIEQILNVIDKWYLLGQEDRERRRFGQKWEYWDKELGVLFWYFEFVKFLCF